MDRIPGSFAVEGTLSQAIEPKVSTTSADASMTNPPITSSPNVPFSPIHQGVRLHNQSWKTSMMCTKPLLHDSNIAGNNEDRLTQSHPTHNTSNFFNHNKSIFNWNMSTTSTPSDVRIHTSDYYAHNNIEELCAHNLELFEALAAINPEKDHQIQQSHTQNSPKISNIQNSSTQQSMPNITEQPMFTWDTPQEEQAKTAQDDPSEPSNSSSSHSSKNSCSTKSSSTKRKGGNKKSIKIRKIRTFLPLLLLLVYLILRW